MTTYFGYQRGALRVAGALVALTLLAGLAACSSGGSASDSKSSAVTTDANGAITIVAKDNTYSAKAFTAKAGQKTTVTLNNQGSAIHNFQLLNQNGPDGKEIQTALIKAGESGSVDFTLPAGSYEYYCAVHPAEMRGKLKVE